MAWTEQAWRHALAGLPDPAQSEDEYQFHLGLVGAGLAGTAIAYDGDIAATLGSFSASLAGTFSAQGSFDGDIDITLDAFTVEFSGTYALTPLAWDYDETLTLTITPEPSGFDVTTRYAIANVPAVGLTDSINRDGDLVSTLSGFTTDFDGTVDNSSATFDGDIATTLDAFSTVLSGTFVFRHYFDIAYSVTPTWIVTEQPAGYGDLNVTLGGFTTGFVGEFLPVDSTQGQLSAGLSAFSIDFDGTLTAPQSFDGSAQIDIASFNSAMLGTVFESGTTGFASLQIGAFNSDFDGTFEVWNTDGALGRRLASLTCHTGGSLYRRLLPTALLMPQCQAFRLPCRVLLIILRSL